MTTVVTERDIRELVGFDRDALQQIEQSFDWASNRQAEIPPVMHYSVSEWNGDVDVKGAYVPGIDHFAVKIASGFYDNPKAGLPSSSGLMIVINARTGICDAVLLDNGYLTNLRTGLAGATAAKRLAPSDIDTVGIVGTGAQGRMQVMALRLVRDFRRVLVFGIDAEEVQRYVDEMSDVLGIPVESTGDVASLVKSSQCVVTTTPSNRPIIDAGMLHPELHITAMGSDLPGKQELDAAVLDAVDQVFCDKLTQSARIGELQHAADIDLLAPVELGHVVAGKHPGRTAAGEVTVCDLSGVGTQDTAIALETLRRIGRRAA